jgi:hypothetical protein
MRSKGLAAGATKFGPPDFQVARESPGSDLAETVGFGEVFDGDYGWHDVKNNLNTKACTPEGHRDDVSEVEVTQSQQRLKSHSMNSLRALCVLSG